MRIDGLPNPQKGSQPNQRAESARTRSKAGRADDSALKRTAETPNPRIAEIRERVQSGFYNSGDVRRQIAGALFESNGIRPVVNEVAEIRTAHRQLADVPDVREDRVAQSRQRAASGFYDQADIRTQTAQSIIDESI